MIELLAVAAFLVVGLTLFGRRPRAFASSVSVPNGPRLQSSEPDGADLPCPWCRAPTRETDDICPSCGQRFG